MITVLIIVGSIAVLYACTKYTFTLGYNEGYSDGKVVGHSQGRIDTIRASMVAAASQKPANNTTKKVVSKKKK